MKRTTHHDIIDALRDLTDRAEQFVNRAPQSKRQATERHALLDAITTAQLVLSIYQKLSEEDGTPGPSKTRPPRE